jgi:hypothetical protein
MPGLVFVVFFLLLWLTANLGALVNRKVRPIKEEERKDFELVQSAILTLLGLLVGFTFSMAISRYDERKTLEEAEANAIGTEYVRADLLPAADAAQVRDLLRQYLDQRISFYKTRDDRHLDQVNAATDQLQSQMWTRVQVPASAQPSPVNILAVSGMNDVINSQGYTEGAWLNRIPTEAWYLMAAISLCSNLLIGYGARTKGRILFLILPLAASLSFFLVADIDSPRQGLVSVQPENLVILSHSFHPDHVK